MPLLKRMNLKLNVLKAPDERWEKENYGVMGAPWNFLLDAEGRLIYRYFYVRNSEELRVMESRIEWLLAHVAPQSDNNDEHKVSQ